MAPRVAESPGTSRQQSTIEREQMLSKHQIAGILADQAYGNKRQIANILDGLADLAMDEIEAGEDFTVPGICRLSFAYRAPQAKGARWKKGDSVVGFGGVEAVKDADSPAVTGQVKLRAAATAKIKGLLPKSTDKPAQSAFLRSKVGKAVAARKGR